MLLDILYVLAYIFYNTNLFKFFSMRFFMDEKEIIYLYNQGSINDDSFFSVPNFNRIVGGLLKDVYQVPLLFGNKDLSDDYKINYLAPLNPRDEFRVKHLRNFSENLFKINHVNLVKSFSSSFCFNMLSPYKDNEESDFMHISYRLNALPGVMVSFAFKRDQEGVQKYSVNANLSTKKPVNDLEKEALEIVS